MPIENNKTIELQLAIELRQAYEEAVKAGFTGSPSDFVNSMSEEALRSLLRKGGRVKLNDGGPIDLYQEWIKLIKLRSALSPTERETVDYLIDKMTTPKVGTETSVDKDKK